MQRFLLAFAVILFTTSLARAEVPDKGDDTDPITFGPDDWPWWRGPNRNGEADPKQKPPMKWSETENVLWKTPVPGRGHGSPIVVGDNIFLATADHLQETQSMLCYHRQTGKLLWQTEIHKGVLQKANEKSSLASSTAACDGQRVFITFLHNKAIYATALSLDGKQLWQTKITDYILHQGFASSPTVYKSLVIVGADNKGKGVIAALDRKSGDVVWKQERPKLPNYASPIIYHIGGKDQLFFTGCKLVTSFDPLTGKKNWEINGSTEETVTSTVTDGERIIISGGYPKQHVSAIHADGSGKVAWEIKTQVYVPSMLHHQGYLYAMADGGIPICWKFDTGKEVWKGRAGGSFSASPVLVGEHIFATNESGRTFIYKASPAAFDLIAENQLGTNALATPTYCGSRIYMRVAFGAKRQRQEMLYCLGN
jgi:outer membrane protein assembly factor BamB